MEAPGELGSDVLRLGRAAAVAADQQLAAGTQGVGDERAGAGDEACLFGERLAQLDAFGQCGAYLIDGCIVGVIKQSDFIAHDVIFSTRKPSTPIPPTSEQSVRRA